MVECHIQCHPPNSPNTAPAGQNDHPTSSRKCGKTAETSPSSVPEYCACHEKWHSSFTNHCTCHTEWLALLDPRQIWNVIYNCAEQPMWHLSIAKYCACHTKRQPNIWHIICKLQKDSWDQYQLVADSHLLLEFDWVLWLEGIDSCSNSRPSVPGPLEAFVFLDAAPKPRSSKLQEQFNFETFVPEVIIEKPG